MMNKRLAELLKKRTELKKEARDLVEATDIPLEELERKSEAVVKALAEVEAAIEALKKLLDVAEEVDQEAAQTESTAEAIAEGAAESDPAAPTDEGRSVVRGSGVQVIDLRDRLMGRHQRKRERLARLRIPKDLRQGLVDYLRTQEVSPSFRAAIRREAERRGVVDTVSGGILIPLYVEEEVVTDIGDLVMMRQLATVKQIPGNTNVPVITGVSKFRPVPENAQYPEIDVEFGGPMLRPLKIGGIATISYEIMVLTPHDVEAEVSDALAEGRADNEEEMLLVGTGVGEPTGVVTAAEARVTAAQSALAAQDIIDLYYSIPLRYRNKGVWLMNPKTAAMLRGLEDSAGNPIWEPEGLKNDVERLLGKPVYTSDYVPEIGPGNKSVIFGDLSEYIIGDRDGLWMQILREKYSDHGQIGIQLTYFVDANVRRSRALGAIQHAA